MPPREAATVVLLRPQTDDEDGPYEVYLVRRPRRAGFMPDSHVFPGGKVDARDNDPALACSPIEAAAVREAFEECGVLLCADSAGRVPAVGEERWVAHRHALRAGLRHLADVLRAEEVHVARERLLPWAHWITPSGEPVRFSAHFFVARLPPGQIAEHAPGELVDELWATPSQVLAREAAGELKLPPPTYFTLWELASLSTLALVRAAASARQTATILPKFQVEGAQTRILLPWDADYAQAPGETLAVPPGFPRPPWSRHVLEGGRWWRNEEES